MPTDASRRDCKSTTRWSIVTYRHFIHGGDMPIQALPENTARVIGSAQVLTDARSVVRELVENALDARATAISVEISSNTLDVIQVRDNGTGIDVEDRQLLCKRGCTSKIRSLEDLECLGGSSLGFRGEALASIVELSQAVVVTTRVDGEVVGTSINYGASGMLSSSSASHPVGTTIRVQNFLSKIPVRKQTALKDSTKALKAIRDVLISLAFARPEVRLSLKVLKGKSDKINWTYAPAPTGSLTEMATKILGKDIISECTAHTISSDDGDVDLDHGWKINALLLSATSASTNARNARQYVSIDGRPMRTDGGTMRELVKLYKRYLQTILPSSASSSTLRPFLLMHIQCPPQSYDVNVEPTKDEVLFGRPDQLLSLVECLFNRAYSGLEDSPIYVSDDDEAPLSPATVSISARHTSGRDLVEAEGRQSLLQHDDLYDADTETTLTSSPSVRNPFTIAAMNAQVRPVNMDMYQVRATSDIDQNSPMGGDTALTIEYASGTARASSKLSESPWSDDWRPRRSLSPRSGPPMRPRVKTSAKRENEGSTQISDDSNAVTTPQKSNLQGWLTRNPGSHLPSGSNVISPNGPDPDSSGKNLGALEARSRIYIDLTSPPSTSETRRGWGFGQKPFKVPLKRQDPAEPSGVVPLTPPPSLPPHHQLSFQEERHGLSVVSKPIKDGSEGVRIGQQVQSRSSSVRLARSSETGALQPNSELDEIMDFEYRKKATIAHQRRAARGLTAASSKGLNRPGHPEPIFASASVSGGDGSTQGASTEDYGTRFGAAESSQIPTPSASNPHPNLRAVQDLPPTPPQLEGGVQLESDKRSNTLETDIADGDLRTPELPPDDPRAHLMRQGQKSAKGKIYRTKSSKLPLERTPPDALTLNLVLTTDALDDTSGVYRRQVQALGTSDPYITRGLTQYVDFVECDASSIDKTWGSILQEVVKTGFRYKGDDGRGFIPGDVRIVVPKVFGS